MDNLLEIARLLAAALEMANAAKTEPVKRAHMLAAAAYTSALTDALKTETQPTKRGPGRPKN